MRCGFTVLALFFAFAATAQDGAEAPSVLTFEGYPDAPEFSVVPRTDQLTFFPCTDCHEFLEPDPTIRELMAPHEITPNMARAESGASLVTNSMTAISSSRCWMNP